MNTDSPKILSLEALSIGYVSGRTEKVLLPPLNASAMQGELIAVIGKNGIGKSTLLRTLAGLHPQLGGEIFYRGNNVRDFSRMDLALEVGYISTEIVKVSNMSVYDLVSLGRFPHTNWLGKIDDENHEVIINAIEKAGMSSMSHRFITELSDGERQRAMIARILAQDTGILVMDEPTAFLDIGSKFEILHLMHVLSQERGKTIIFSTHDLHAAISQADKIWLILKDRLIEGAPEDLMIAGAFEHLFDSTHVHYNSEHGNYSFISNEKGFINISGDGIVRHWTEKAINRAGFSVSDTKTEPHILIPSGKNKNWQLIFDSCTLEFRSIYEMIKWLSKENIHPIC